MVILYKFYFLFSHFSSQPNKRVFHPFAFLPSQPNTYKRTKSFISFYFSILSPFSILSLFYSPNQMDPKIFSSENWESSSKLSSKQKERLSVGAFAFQISFQGKNNRSWPLQSINYRTNEYQTLHYSYYCLSLVLLSFLFFSSSFIDGFFGIYFSYNWKKKIESVLHEHGILEDGEKQLLSPIVIHENPNRI